MIGEKKIKKYLKLALFIAAIAALLTVCAFAEDGVNEADLRQAQIMCCWW